VGVVCVNALRERLRLWTEKKIYKKTRDERELKKKTTTLMKNDEKTFRTAPFPQKAKDY